MSHVGGSGYQNHDVRGKGRQLVLPPWQDVQAGAGRFTEQNSQKNAAQRGTRPSSAFGNLLACTASGPYPDLAKRGPQKLLDLYSQSCFNEAMALPILTYMSLPTDWDELKDTPTGWSIISYSDYI